MKTRATPVLDLDNLPWPNNQPQHFVFDVDGTLTDEDSVTHPPTLHALKAAVDRGYAITLATGRLLHAGVRVLERANIDGWVIASCGSVVWDGENVVDEHPIPVPTVERFIELGRELGMTPAIYYVDDIVMEPAGGMELPEATSNATEGKPIKIANLDTVDLNHVTKVQFGADIPVIEKYQDRIVEEFPGVVRGHPYFLELPPAGITKWEGIETALARRNLSAETGLGAGDSGNDVPWLPRMGISVAAPDSSPDVFEVVDAILPPSTYPVADLINTILRRNDEG